MEKGVELVVFHSVSLPSPDFRGSNSQKGEPSPQSRQVVGRFFEAMGLDPLKPSELRNCLDLARACIFGDRKAPGLQSEVLRSGREMQGRSCFEPGGLRDWSG